MKNRKAILLTSIFAHFVSSIDAGNRPGIGIKFNHFIEDLEHNIQAYEKIPEESESMEYQIFHTTDDMEIKEFITLRQLVHGQSDSNTKVTVIQVYSDEGINTCNIEEFKKHFVYATSKYIDSGEVYSSLDNTCVSFSTIPLSTLWHYDIVDRNNRNTKKLLNAVNTLVINHKNDFTASLIKQRLFTNIQSYLKYLLSDEIQKIPNTDEIATVINKARIGNFSQDYIDLSSLTYSERHLGFICNDLAYKKFCNEVFGLEKSIGCEYFRKRPELLFKRVLYILSVKQEEAFNQRWRDVLSLILSDENGTEANKEAFSNFVTRSMDEINELFSSDYAKEEYKDKNEFIKDLNNNQSFRENFTNYFETLDVASVQKSLVESENLIVFQKFADENTTTIILGSELNATTIYPLWDALNLGKIFDGINQYRYTYISNEKSESLKAYIRNQEKLTTISVKSVYDSRSVVSSSARFETIGDQKSEIKGQDSNPPEKCNDESQGKQETGALTPSTGNIKICKVKITVEKYGKFTFQNNLSSILEGLKEKCSFKHDDVSESKYKVVLSNGGQQSYVYFQFQADALTNIEKLSIFFDLHCSDSKGNGQLLNRADRNIYCFDNAPGSVLMSLKQQLLHRLLEGSALFEIPNLWKIGKMNYAHSERFTTVESCRGLLDLMRKGIKNQFPAMSKILAETHILNEEITQLNNPESLVRKRILKLVIQKAKIEEIECNTLISNSVQKKHVDSGCGQKTTEFNFKYPNIIGIFVTSNKEGKRLLHTCELKRMDFCRYISIFTLNMLNECLKTEENISLSEGVHDTYKTISRTTKLSPFIIRDFVMQLDFKIKYCSSQPIFAADDWMENIVDRLVDPIYNSYDAFDAILSGESSKPSSRINFRDFVDAIKEPISIIAKKLAEEFEKTSLKYYVKILSLLLGDSEASKEIESVETTLFYKDIGLLGEAD